MKKATAFTILLFILTFARTSAEAANFTVTRTDDRNNPTCAVGDCSLREAVKAAENAFSDDNIYFAGSLNGQSITLTAEISVANPGTMTITGPSANLLTIDGGAGSNRIFFFANGTIVISDVTLTGGNAEGGAAPGIGGAVAINGGNLTLNRVHVTGNSVTQTGGGVGNLGGTLKIRNSTFSLNTAGNHGGAIDNFGGGTLTVVNSTFSGNSAVNQGGGIFNFSAAVTIVNSTFSGNTAGNGGGVAMFAGTSMSFANTIIAGNTATLGQPEIYYSGGGTVTSAGNNLIGDTPGDAANTGLPVTYQMSDKLDMNPLLNSLTNNGGGLPTRALLAGSPAIDAGNNAQAIDPSNANAPLTRDQRGYLRVVNGAVFGAIVDIGAYEFSAAPSAATVFVGGRISFNKGSLVSRASVTLTEMSGNVKTAIVNPFGYYRFEDVSAGQTVTVQVSAKGAVFAAQVVTVNENIEDLNFTAQ